MDNFWALEALQRCNAGEELALITLTLVEGSAPRDAGARMLVWGEGQSGTIGGGNLEFILTRDARAFLAGNDRAIERRYPLGPVLGQCCGGHVTAKIERLNKKAILWLEREVEAEYDRRPHLYILGGGHVGAALKRAAEPLPFHIRWLDTRANTGAQQMRDPATTIECAPSRSYFVVLTHNHDLDYELVRAVLARRDAAYCGLIGSKSKRARFARQLRADGVGEELIRLTCPIGGSIGLKGKAPEFIAAATIAELLLVYETRTVTAPEAAHVE